MEDQMFCKHNYNIISQFETKSHVEQLHEYGLRPNTHTSFDKKSVTILKCEKCNKIKKIIIKF